MALRALLLQDAKKLGKETQLSLQDRTAVSGAEFALHKQCQWQVVVCGKNEARLLLLGWELLEAGGVVRALLGHSHPRSFWQS